MQMQKLISLLEKANIPFETDFDSFSEIQVFYPNKKNCICDAVCHQYSYGGDKGLLEIMGLVENTEDLVEGYLTAQQVFNKIKKHYNKNKETINKYL